MNTINKLRKHSLLGLLFVALSITSCKKKEIDPVAPPAVENEDEIITDVKLIFTNTMDSTDIVEARAQDPDGAGVQELTLLDEINLSVGKTYKLTFKVMNNLDSPGADIGAEIAEENKDHQLFFSFSNDAFTNPLGNGNIDKASDPLNYNDADANGNPVGLSTNWTTSATQLSGGAFTVRLQHQPGIKSAASGANDGDTDFELPFVLNIQ
jgi:hypothetical protein